ncbi:MAG: ATP-binding protein [Pseudomonadota bacterium]
MNAILSTMQEGVLVIKADGCIGLTNPALREMLLLPDDAVGKPPLEVIRNADLQEALKTVQSSRDTVSTEIELAAVLDANRKARIRDGGTQPRRLLVRASTLAGQAASILVVLVDVTELRRLETVRRGFVANVSHELRTPITAVRSAAETLLTSFRAQSESPDREPDREPNQEPKTMDGTANANNRPSMNAETTQRFLEIIDRNAERLHHLVEDLLDLSRIESRQYRMELEPVEIGSALAHLAALMQERAEKQGIAIRVETPPDDPIVAHADKHALEQVLANLVDNAIKYCGPGSEVVLSAENRNHGREATLRVADNGPGIEARHLPRLFERFYRVDAGRSREQGGTGLGLAIVKHLVEAMDGRISVESTPGKGSSFTLALRTGAPAPKKVS